MKGFISYINIKNVDKVYLSIDKDRVLKTIQFIHEKLNPNYDLYFANGGDQVNESILERSLCKKLGIGLIGNLEQSPIIIMVIKKIKMKQNLFVVLEQDMLVDLLWQ